MAKSIKASQDIQELEQKSKNRPYTFGFKHFETSMKTSDEKTFNNKFSSILHFIKTNSDLINAMKLISRETYKTTIIEKKLEKVMHFKIIDRPESIERVTGILTDVYKNSKNVIDELLEGSQFVEFGMTDGCRYIGVIVDYCIIELLYLDPNHLTFADNRFDIPSKMSYTYPSLYDISSDKIINSSTSSFKFDVDINKEIYKSYSIEKEDESIKIILYAIKELYDGTISDEDAIETLKKIEEERRNEK